MNKLTQFSSSQAHRIVLLASSNEKLFHVKDLANLWNIKNENTLYTVLKRYSQAGLLYRIYKGFYSLLPSEKLDPVLLGAKAIHQFCYLSTESVLYAEGYISQKVDPLTFVSEKSFKFKINGHSYVNRKLADKFLYQPEGIIEKNGIKFATTQRAIADMLYFNPFFHFDKKVDFQEIKKLQLKIGYPLTFNRYDFTKTK